MSIKNNKVSLAGFCGINFGEISKSYCVSNMANYKNKSSFCFRNIGNINQCFATTVVKKSKLDCFCEQNSGIVSQCFNDIDSDSNSFTNTNGVYSCNFSNCKIKSMKDECNVELSDKWFNLRDDENLLSVEIRKNVLSPNSDDIKLKPTFIRNKSQLFSISEKILSGDINAASAYYILNVDIDLKGKCWIPIGSDG